MATRYTRKDAERIAAQLAEKIGANPEYGPGHVYMNRESGVYRLRLVLAGGGERDLSPGMTTAFEAWLYVRGVMDGLDSPYCIAAQVAEQDA